MVEYGLVEKSEKKIGKKETGKPKENFSRYDKFFVLKISGVIKSNLKL